RSRVRARAPGHHHRPRAARSRGLAALPRSTASWRPGTLQHGGRRARADRRFGPPDRVAGAPQGGTADRSRPGLRQAARPRARGGVMSTNMTDAERRRMAVAVERMARALGRDGRPWPRLCAAVMVARAATGLDLATFAARLRIDVTSLRALETGRCA